MTWPLRYYHKWRPFMDAHTYSQVCRFFTDDVLATVEEVSLAAPEQVAISETFDAERDLHEHLRNMWDDVEQGKYWSESFDG